MPHFFRSCFALPRLFFLLLFSLIAGVAFGQTNYESSVVVRPDGTLWAWGYDNAGSMGDGTTTPAPTPRFLPGRVGTATNWRSASSGGTGEFAVALRTNGTLWTWGNFAANVQYTPTQVGADTNWQSASAGSMHIAAVRTDGTLWTWGSGPYGELGNGTASNTAQTAPTQLGTDANWRSASAGTFYTLAVRQDGTLWAWGANHAGQLGDGTTTNRLSPVQIGTDTNWQSVAAGQALSAAIKTDGTLWHWGSFGNRVPTQVGTATDWASVYPNGFAIRTDGSLWAWGNNQFGRLGDGTVADRTTPVRVGTDTNWLRVAVSRGHTVAVRTDGSVWAWGYNGYGEIGNLAVGLANQFIPKQIGTATDWQRASAGGAHSAGIKTDGSLWLWGDNNIGQLGDGTQADRPSPAPLDQNTTWQSVWAGQDHTTAVRDDGTLWAWGSNSTYQLGDGTRRDRLQPVRIGGATHWRSANGSSHMMSITSAGTLLGWGENNSGELGDGGWIPKTSPQQTGGWNSSWRSVAAGGNHTVAVRSDGTLWQWGDDSNGLPNYGSRVPVQVGTDNNWQAVAAGFRFNLALRTDGSLWAWGTTNDYGQLGNGTSSMTNPYTQQLAPAQVGSATNWVSVSAGDNHALAIRADGTLWAWGNGSNGELGSSDVTATVAYSPRQIGTDTNWQSASAGYQHSLAIRTDGTLWAWGANDDARLGWLGYTATPVMVLSGATPLPVELIDFTAAPSNGHAVKLRWQTAQEVENKGFTVERSSDGQTFMPIGWVPGSGNSSNVRVYTFDDSTPPIGKPLLYYRLQQRDRNGTANASLVRAVALNDNTELSITAVPTRSTTDVVRIHLTHQLAGPVTVRVINMFGRVLYEQVITPVSTSAELRMPSVIKTVGVYLLSAEQGKRRAVTRLIRE